MTMMTTMVGRMGIPLNAVRQWHCLTVWEACLTAELSTSYGKAIPIVELTEYSKLKSVTSIPKT